MFQRNLLEIIMLNFRKTWTPLCKSQCDKIKNLCISSSNLSKNVHLKNFFGKKSKIRASQVKFIKKRVPQKFLDPIQKRALSRSVQLEVVYLEALL